MPPTAQAALPKRRTQEQRRSETRARLLEATVASLVDRGYAGTTTTEICQRAGVSQGALFRHFPTKADVLAAAAAHLLERIVEQYGEEFDAIAGARDPIQAAVELLWATYQRPELQAAVELYVAARTDTELSAALAEIDPPHRANLHRLARELLPDLAGRPDFDDVVDVILDAVQGAAMATAALPPAQAEPARRRVVATLPLMIRRSL